ncbi:MAG: RNA polymerase sigma factor [Bacteroidota bacterium]
MNDREIVDIFLRTQSEQAFRTLYRQKTPALYRIALRITGDVYVAEELVQEMWCVAVRKLPGFEWRSALQTWLVSILMNLARQQFRGKINHAADADILIDPLSHQAQKMDLEKAINLLAPGYRSVIVLHDIEGYKHHEIAAMLEISEGTSKSQLFNARKILRQFLTQ